jgi:mono/diheme cytochrome c family protein
VLPLQTSISILSASKCAQVSHMIDVVKAATFGLIALSAFCLWAVAAAVEPTPDGDPEHGAALILQLGCGACHIIPGTTCAKGLIGNGAMPNMDVNQPQAHDIAAYLYTLC